MKTMIDQNTIQELASQLAKVYNYSIETAVPIVLKCVQAYHVIPIITLVLVLVSSIFLYRHLLKRYEGGESKPERAAGYILTGVFLTLGLVGLVHIFSRSVVFIIYPEAFIVFTGLEAIR